MINLINGPTGVCSYLKSYTNINCNPYFTNFDRFFSWSLSRPTVECPLFLIPYALSYLIKATYGGDMDIIYPLYKGEGIKCYASVLRAIRSLGGYAVLGLSGIKIRNVLAYGCNGLIIDDANRILFLATSVIDWGESSDDPNRGNVIENRAYINPSVLYSKDCISKFIVKEIIPSLLSSDSFTTYAGYHQTYRIRTIPPKVILEDKSDHIVLSSNRYKNDAQELLLLGAENILDSIWEQS